MVAILRHINNRCVDLRFLLKEHLDLDCPNQIHFQKELLPGQKLLRFSWSFFYFVCLFVENKEGGLKKRKELLSEANDKQSRQLLEKSRLN